VLLLGGATSTLIAGQIALARQLPILAVDEFGGTAGKIWSQLAQASPERPRPAWGTHSPVAFVNQLMVECTELGRAGKRPSVAIGFWPLCWAANIKHTTLAAHLSPCC
jgi:hypothetical protein